MLFLILEHQRTANIKIYGVNSLGIDSFFDFKRGKNSI